MVNEIDAPQRQVAFTVCPVNAASLGAYPVAYVIFAFIPYRHFPSPDGPRQGWVSSPYGTISRDPFRNEAQFTLVRLVRIERLRAPRIHELPRVVRRALA